MSVMGGVGMDLEAIDIPYRIIVAKGNDIPKGASDAFGVGSDCDSNVATYELLSQTLCNHLYFQYPICLQLKFNYPLLELWVHLLACKAQ